MIGQDRAAGRVVRRVVRRVVIVGDVGVDVAVRPAAPPCPGQDTPADIVVTPGGAGANLAARLAGRGLDVTLIARVGSDHPAATARAELSAAGIDCRFTIDEEQPTCTVVVLVGPDGERTMFSDRGAGAGLIPADLDLPGSADPTHLHLSGYVLLDPRTRAAGLAALAAARSRDWSTSLDPQSGPAPGAGPEPQEILRWCAGVDLLLPNEYELDILGGPAAVTPVFGVVAVTRGAAGAAFLRGAERLDRPLPAQPHPAPSYGSGSGSGLGSGSGGLVDTTGAGDAFNAGFLAGWLAGAAPADALQAGMAAGTAATRHPGGRPR